MRNLDNRGTIRPAPPAGMVPLRGPSGRLYGYFDPKGLVIEFRNARSGQHTSREKETVDLKPLINPAE